MNGEMMMRPPVPVPYQVWAAALAQQQRQQLPPAAMAEPVPAGLKPARPAWKRVGRKQQQRRSVAAERRLGGSEAPRNTTSYLIRSKSAGGVAALVSPCPVTPAVLPTPVLSPAREVLVEMAKEAWGVDGYGSMKGLIRLRPQQQAADAWEDGSGSGESDVEEHVEVERRLDHDLSRFEMVQLPAAPAADEEAEDVEARAARLEEENLALRARLFLMERDMADIRRRLVAVESLCRDRHRDGCVVDGPSEAIAGAGESDAADAMAL
jgi:hypothetical protein